MSDFGSEDADLPGLKKFPWRFVAYLGIVLYLVADLYLIGGPLRRRVEKIRGGGGEAATDLARGQGIVATVNAHPIYREDLDRAVGEYCLRRGLEPGSLPRQRHNAIRVRVLGQLVVDRLIWFHSHHTRVELDGAELEEARARFRRGFVSAEAFESAVAEQGFTDVGQLDAFLENQAMQRAWIERVIAPHIVVTEEEVAARYTEDAAVAEVPERRRVRHIFLATLDKDPAVVEGAITAVAARLAAEDFAALAAELSEDERSKEAGGDLGWIGRERLPEDFADAVFALAEGQVSAPFQTRLGWHIAQVVERRPPRRADLAEVRGEIAATLEAEKRELAIDALVAHVKGKAKIHYFADYIWVE